MGNKKAAKKLVQAWNHCLHGLRNIECQRIQEITTETPVAQIIVARERKSGASLSCVLLQAILERYNSLVEQIFGELVSNVCLYIPPQQPSPTRHCAFNFQQLHKKLRKCSAAFLSHPLSMS